MSVTTVQMALKNLNFSSNYKGSNKEIRKTTHREFAKKFVSSFTTNKPFAGPLACFIDDHVQFWTTLFEKQCFIAPDDVFRNAQHLFNVGWDTLDIAEYVKRCGYMMGTGTFWAWDDPSTPYEHLCMRVYDSIWQFTYVK